MEVKEMERVDYKKRLKELEIMEKFSIEAKKVTAKMNMINRRISSIFLNKEEQNINKLIDEWRSEYTKLEILAEVLFLGVNGQEALDLLEITCEYVFLIDAERIVESVSCVKNDIRFFKRILVGVTSQENN